jgi:mono/diheme cytochrome c family protein
MKKWRFAICALALANSWAAAGSLWQRAPARAAHLHNPRASDQTARRAGAKLYERECASCHGAARLGSAQAPPLDRADIRSAPPGALFWVLRNGSLRKGMPSFAHLPEAQRWQIIVFLQTQGQAPSIAPPPSIILDKTSY